MFLAVPTSLELNMLCVGLTELDLIHWHCLLSFALNYVHMTFGLSLQRSLCLLSMRLLKYIRYSFVGHIETLLAMFIILNYLDQYKCCKHVM